MSEKKTSVTLIIFKPDASADEREEMKLKLREKGLALMDSYTRNEPEKKLFEQHYEEHKGKSFYNDLINHMVSGCCFYSIWSGEKAVENGRKVLENVRQSMRKPSEPLYMNRIHASDKSESAQREIKIWFPKEYERYRHLFQ
tara:strand:- start:201 stop:626 length:426 start_codon:yes stop_codon:yes gene_type:complete